MTADAVCPSFADEAFDFATAFMSPMDMFGEPCADEATAAAVPAVADTRAAPLLLHVRGRKPAAKELRR